MKRLSEIPFIHISKENLEAASDMLDREQKGELMEMLIDAVLNDGSPTTEDRYVNGVFNQFMSVIARTTKGYSKRIEALERVNEQKKKDKEMQVSTYTPEPIAKAEPPKNNNTDNSITDFAYHLLNIEKEKGKGAREYEMNEIVMKNGIDYYLLLNEFNRVKAAV